MTASITTDVFSKGVVRQRAHSFFDLMQFSAPIPREIDRLKGFPFSGKHHQKTMAPGRVYLPSARPRVSGLLLP